MSTSAIPLTARATMPGGEATHRARLDALAALDGAGWPTRRREQWRYTDLEPLASSSYELEAPPADAARLDAVRRLLGDKALGEPQRQLVLIDGQRVAGLGATSIDDITVIDLEEHWEEFVRRFAEPLRATHYPLAALNTAFGQRGLWLRVPAGTIGEPIHLVIVGSHPRLASQPRIVIEAESGARATFVQHFIDSDPGSHAWTNAVTQLKLADRSSIDLYRMQSQALGAVHTSLLTAELAAGAALTAGYFDLGGRLVRNDVAIDLRGVDARAELFGLLLAGENQHIDDHTLIRHAAGATVSDENLRCIVGERGRGVFNGKVVVEPGCQRIDARQRNDNLLLGVHAEVDTKPELEIYANDVKCSHGATVGELDAEQLFYLRARGLDLAAARRLLTSAFASTVVEHIAEERVRVTTLERVAARLATLTES